MTQVLVVGMAVVDFVFEVEELPASAEKHIAQQAQIVGGGGAANAACAIANLGGHAMLAARVGCDTVGELIIEDLLRQNVDCSLVARTDQARSSFSSVLLDAAGERQIVNYRGAGLSEDVSQIEIAQPHAVLVDTRWQAGALAAMRLAKQRMIPAVVDAEAPLDSSVMELASHIAFSRQGLESYSGALQSVAQIEAALRGVNRCYPAWLAMTDGADGVYSLHDGQFAHIRAASIDIVDTLGAGDVWHGAFTYWLGCGYAEQVAVEFANAAATLKCSTGGGGRSSPGLDQVLSFM